jgi:Holliday junction resolvase RusA-like endonuclease
VKLAFFVPGVPQPKGSRRMMPVGGKTGALRHVLIEDGTRLTRPLRVSWYSRVAKHASAAFQGPSVASPVVISALFRFPIARSRLKGKRRLKPGDPHTQKPDGDKCLRGIFDPLKVAGVVIDDCVFFKFQARKEWCAEGDEGAEVLLTW